jgi:hypothetical protein
MGHASSGAVPAGARRRLAATIFSIPKPACSIESVKGIYRLVFLTFLFPE